jgi:hypothetical protein
MNEPYRKESQTVWILAGACKGDVSRSTTEADDNNSPLPKEEGGKLVDNAISGIRRLTGFRPTLLSVGSQAPQVAALAEAVIADRPTHPPSPSPGFRFRSRRDRIQAEICPKLSQLSSRIRFQLTAPRAAIARLPDQFANVPQLDSRAGGPLPPGDRDR